MEVSIRDFPKPSKICGRDPKYIWYDGLQAMTTPMTTNLKLLNDDSSEIVDVTLYR